VARDGAVARLMPDRHVGEDLLEGRHIAGVPWPSLPLVRWQRYA
jgi:hypothetical protein